MSTILVVEDDLDIARLVSHNLTAAGHVVVDVHDFDAAHEILKTQTFDLMVLDWMLPEGLSGIDLLSKNPNKIPAIMMTAKDTVEDELTAFQLGVVDFISKPFSISVLISRVENILKLTAISKMQKDGPEILEFDELEIFLLRRIVKCKGKAVSLTKTEFSILAELAQTAGNVLSREDLIILCRGSGVNVSLRTIDTHVYTLRKKLGKFNRVETSRGFGYHFRLSSK